MVLACARDDACASDGAGDSVAPNPNLMSAFGDAN